MDEPDMVVWSRNATDPTRYYYVGWWTPRRHAHPSPPQYGVIGGTAGWVTSRRGARRFTRAEAAALLLVLRAGEKVDPRLLTWTFGAEQVGG